MSYFIFNNVKSSDLGIRIQSKNVYSSPKYDANLISVPGRSGDLISSNGRFSNGSISYTCYIPAKSIQELSDKITIIKNWLYKEPDKYHDLEDSYDSKFRRKAIFNSKLDIVDEVSKVGTFTIMFSCKPQRFLISSLDIETHMSSFDVENPYSLAAKPYLKIHGTGDVSLVIQSDDQNKIWNIKDLDGYIECDAELMNFYKGTLLRNNKVTGNGFPEIPPGKSTISWVGNVTKIEMIRRLVSL